MSVYQTKEFAKFARKAKLGARQLLIAAREVARGEFDADLGAGVFKQRIARSGAASRVDFAPSCSSGPAATPSSHMVSPRTKRQMSMRRN